MNVYTSTYNTNTSRQHQHNVYPRRTRKTCQLNPMLPSAANPSNVANGGDENADPRLSALNTNYACGPSPPPQQQLQLPKRFETSVVTPFNVPPSSSFYSEELNDEPSDELVEVGYPVEFDTEPEEEGEEPQEMDVLYPECIPLDLSRLGEPHRKIKVGPFFEDNVKEKEMDDVDSQSMLTLGDSTHSTDTNSNEQLPEVDTKKGSWFRRRRPENIPTTLATSTATTATTTNTPEKKKRKFLSRMFKKS